LTGRRFGDGEELKSQWLDNQTKYYWREVMKGLGEKWQKCHNLGGDYVEMCKVSA
jgi:hypothetical protein